MTGILSMPTLNRRKGGGLLSSPPQIQNTPVFPGELERLAQQQAFAGYGSGGTPQARQQSIRGYLDGLYGNAQYGDQDNGGGDAQQAEPEMQWVHGGLPFPEANYEQWQAQLAQHALSTGMTPEQMQRAGWRQVPMQGQPMGAPQPMPQQPMMPRANNDQVMRAGPMMPHNPTRRPR